MKKFFLKVFSEYNQIPLEGKIFSILAIICIAFSFITTILNIVLKLNMLTIFIALSTTVFSFYLLYYSQKKKNYIISSYIGIFTLEFIICPLLWLTNGGSAGPTPYFFIFNTILIVVLLSKSNIKPIIITNFIMIFSLIYLEFKHPYLIDQYTSEFSRIIDLSLSLLLICIFVLIMLVRVMKEYNNKINELNNIQEQLRVLSITDELSGIYNRRFVMNKLLEDLNTIPNLSVIMFDIDNFKKINDKYGHTFGDEVIRVVSQTFRDNIRVTDTIGRIGGEEFLLLIDESNLSAAKLRADSLREIISNLEWSKPGLSITVSGGVYSKKQTDTIDVILDNVDLCLYEAKKKGRNIIISTLSEQTN